MQITIDTKDSEEDIRKAITILQKLLEEKRQPEPEIQIVSDMPEKEAKKTMLSDLLPPKKEPARKKDEAFDVGEVVPY